jgi:hypothetical protein
MSLANIYYQLIKHKRRNKDDVPENLREEVEAMLNENDNSEVKTDD